LCGLKAVQVKRLLLGPGDGCATDLALRQPNQQPFGGPSDSCPFDNDLLGVAIPRTFGDSERRTPPHPAADGSSSVEIDRRFFVHDGAGSIERRRA